MHELLSWSIAITLLVALPALAFGAMALPKNPWYRHAQGAFVATGIVADAKIVAWAITSLHALSTRIVVATLFLVVINALVVGAILKVQESIQEERTQLPSEIDQSKHLSEAHVTVSPTPRPALIPGQVIDRSRRLSPYQKERLVKTLKQTEFPPVVRLRYRNIDMEACQFVQDFQDAFSEAGWTKIVNEYRAADYETRRGLLVATKWNHIPPSGAHDLVNALKDIGFTVDLKPSRSVPHEDDVVFFVGGIED